MSLSVVQVFKHDETAHDDTYYPSSRTINTCHARATPPKKERIVLARLRHSKIIIIEKTDSPICDKCKKFITARQQYSVRKCTNFESDREDWKIPKLSEQNAPILDGGKFTKYANLQI